MKFKKLIAEMWRKSRTALLLLKEDGWREVAVIINKKTGCRYLDVGKDSVEIYLTYSKTNREEMGLASTTRYPRASSGCELDTAVKELEIKPSDTIIDIGCGKGVAMIRLAKFPFRKVDGIERSPEWADIARKNISRLWLRNRSNIICTDALTFTALDEYSHIYLYNPFPREVMQVVVKNIQTSLKRTPRPLTIIYSCPMHHDLFIEAEIFEKVLEFEFENFNPIYIYRPCLAFTERVLGETSMSEIVV
jgi:SAM-dependent methyltransferase